MGRSPCVHRDRGQPSAWSSLDGGRERTIRVLIVDDHALFADAIAPSLQAEGMRVVAVASTAQLAFEAVERENPDLILMDLGLPDMSGFEAGKSILERFPDAKLIALTARDDH